MSRNVAYRYDPRRHQLSIRDADGNIVYLRGVFDVDSANRLLYRLSEPSAFRRVYDLPPVIACEGNWRLTPDCALTFRMAVTGAPSRERTVTFKTTIVSASARQLVCTVNAGGETLRIKTVTLRGAWRTDTRNRLSFVMSRSGAKNDRLAFTGIWTIDRNNELRYICSRTVLRTRTKKVQELRFTGTWELTKKDRLVYVLDAVSGTKLAFKVHLQSDSIRARAGAIRYRLGAGVAGQVVTLYGEWKFGRAGELAFELSGRSSSVTSLTFSATRIVKTGDRLGIEVRLRDDVKPAFILTWEKKQIPSLKAALRLMPDEWKATIGLEGAW